MKLTFRGRSADAGTARLAAEVVWEDSAREPAQLFFEVPSDDAEYLGNSAHAFVVGCVVPAMRHGERRIAIDERCCPLLLENLRTAMAWQTRWNPAYRAVELEIPVSSSAEQPAPRAASFMSGGLDSLFTIRHNRLSVPRDHPASLRDAIFVYGFDVGDRAGDPEAALLSQVLKQLQPIAADASVRLIEVTTNLKRDLDNDTYFWMHHFHGAALASVAHALGRRVTLAYVSSTYDVPNVSLAGWGSHPVLDHLYSSAATVIRHEASRFSRLDKLRLVAGWPSALASLRVCSKDTSGRNCERCEKCLRTMAEFEALGILESSGTFRTRRLTPDALSALRIRNSFQAACFAELSRPLRGNGRDDLARVIEQRLRTWRVWQRMRSLKHTVLPQRAGRPEHRG